MSGSPKGWQERLTQGTMQVGWPMGHPDAISGNWGLSGEISEMDTHSSHLPKCHAESRKGISNLVINRQASCPLCSTPPSTWQCLTSPEDKLSHRSINFQNAGWQCSLRISMRVFELKNGIPFLVDGRSNWLLDDSNPLQCSCLENPMDMGAWWAAVHGIARSRTQLSDFTFTFHFHALEKEMAIHSNVLAWRIPGTGEPGGLPSMGSHRVGHDWIDLA